jgi:kynureninase
MIEYRSDKAFAKEMDETDSLCEYRKRFYFPKDKKGNESLYFCGNSLGLQPVAVKQAILQELEDWKNLAVEGHFNAKNPWLPYHEFLTKQTAAIVGAKPLEVVASNTLTVNLHLLMVSFYQPTQSRFKILIEKDAFPSDRYAAISQIKYHGYNPDIGLIELSPENGEKTISEDVIRQTLETHGEEIALVLLGGVNYYTGQLFNMQLITELAQNKGCKVGFDLAHAAGNVPLQLHEWNVDFACWCSYKYLNSGPGSVAGLFVHEKYAHSFDLPRFCGWWGNDKSTRFEMGPEFKAIPGAEGWQLSNPPILSLAAVKASLDIFDEVGIERLRKKSVTLTGYLEYLLESLNSDAFTIITPSNPEERGAQLSIVLKQNGKRLFEQLHENNIICDWREPDCIRVAPVPLYNSYHDIFSFIEIFSSLLEIKQAKAG